MSGELNGFLSEFVDVDSMTNEIEKTETKRFWRPMKAKTVIRVLPPIKANGEKLPWFEHKVHWIDGQPYECLNQTITDKEGHLHTAEPCPICKMAKSLYLAKTDASQELSKKISAKTRYVTRIVVRDDEIQDPVFYELPFKVYDKFKTAITSKEWGSVVGPMDGRDFTIEKTGEGMYTKYDNSILKPNTSPIMSTSEKIVDVIKKAKDMSYNSLVSFQDAESLKKVAFENDEIARFFGIRQDEQQTSAKPVQASKPASDFAEQNSVSEIAGFDDIDIPEANVSNEKQTSSADDIDALLEGILG